MSWNQILSLVIGFVLGWIIVFVLTRLWALRQRERDAEKLARTIDEYVLHARYNAIVADVNRRRAQENCKLRASHQWYRCCKECGYNNGYACGGFVVVNATSAQIKTVQEAIARMTPCKHDWKICGWFGDVPIQRRCKLCRKEEWMCSKHEWFRIGPGHRVCTTCGYEDKYPSPNKVDTLLGTGGVVTITAEQIARWMVDGNLAEAVEKAVRELKIARGNS